jgi:hypothetical protein
MGFSQPLLLSLAAILVPLSLSGQQKPDWFSDNVGSEHHNAANHHP